MVSKKLVSKKSKKTSRGKEEDINEILKSIAKNIKIEKGIGKGNPIIAKINYYKDNIIIEANSSFQLEDRGIETINFKLDSINITNLNGYGLCPVINIFILRKLYNKAVESYSNNKYKYVSEVVNSSEQYEYAKSCYITAFRSLKFEFKKEEDIYGLGLNPDKKMYFKKENNNKDWKKIEEDLYYTNSRLKIKYTIGTDEIKMEKI